MNSQAHQTSDCIAPVDASPPEALDIPALTRRMVQGDEAAYRAFYDAYFDRMFRYLLVVAFGDEEAAREALQATLVRVVRHIKVLPNEAALWHWLTVLARSALSDQNRRRRRYLAFLDRFASHSLAHHLVTAEPPADDRLATLLEQSLAALPYDERLLLEAKYFERRSVRDVAEETRLSEKAVESRLVRIRRKLKAAILERLKHD